MAESKFKSKKRKAPNTTWVRNAIKSVGYSARESFVSLTPITKKMAESASGVISNRLSSAGKGDLKNAITNNRYVGVAKRTIDRAIGDLKSGNFYDEKRAEQLHMASVGMEDLFDDGGWDSDDEGSEVDFTYVDQRDDGASETTAQASFYVAETIRAGTEATLQASKASLDVMAASSNATLAEIRRVGSQVGDKLTSMDNTLTSILQYHEQNTSNFYETVIAALEKFGKSVEDEKDDPYSYSDRPLKSEDLFSDSALQVDKYGKYIKQRFSNYLSGTTAGQLTAFLSDEKQLEAGLANPVGMITESVIKKMIPSMVKDTLGEFDRTLEDFIPTVLGRIGNLKNDTNDLKGGIKEAFGKIFGLDPSVGRTFDLGKQGRGAATFDKVTRNAITHILPKYARESTSYLKAIAEHFKIDTKKAVDSSEIYDYENGEFVTKKDLQQNLAKGLFAQQTAGYRGTNMYNTVRAGGSDLEGKAAERYEKIVDQLFAYMTQANRNLTASDFDISNKNSYVNLLLGDLEGHTKADKKAKKVLRQTLGIMRDEDLDLAEVAAAQLRGKADYRSYIQLMAENADEYNLRDAGFTDETDIFDFIDEQLGFKQRKRNKEAREKERKKAERLSPTEKAKRKAEEVAKNSRSARKIAETGLKNSMRLNEDGHNAAQFQNYQADGILSTATNAIGHTKNAMSLFIKGADANSIMAEFSAIFSDSIKGLFNSFKENFIDPSVKAIFGEKNVDGFREGGLLAGAQNKIKDTWHAVNLRITGKGYKDSEGNEHTTESEGIRSASAMVKDAMMSIGEGIRFKLFGDKDKDEDGKEKKDKKSGLVGSIIDNMKEGVISWKNALFGTNDKDVKTAVDDVKKKALDAMPNAAVGALGGVAFSHVAGGLLGSLVAGPVGPLVGLTTGLLSKSEKFQRYLFGTEIEDEEGNKKRVGGLISQKTQELFKDPTTKKAMIGGAALGFLKAKIFGSSGGFLGMLVGGPIAGAMLGMGTSLLVRSNTFQTFLFGDEESGKTGLITHLKNAWGKFGSGDKEKNGEKTGLGATILGAAGLGVGGAALGKMIASHGILGASLSAAGPIGGAILGTALAVKLGGKKFQNILFGEKDEETGKRKGGLVTKLANWMHVEVIAPMKTTVLDIGRFIKDEVEFGILEPIRISVEPFGKMLLGGVKKFTDRGKEVFTDIGETVKKKVIDPFLTIMGKLFAPIRTMASVITKTAVKASLAVVTFPVKIMHSMATIIMNPFVQLGKTIKEKIIKPIKTFAKKHVFKLLKGVGKLLVKTVSMPAALAVYGGNKLADRWAGLGRVLGENRYTDDGTYGSEHSRWRKERRDRRKQRNQQRREEKNLDRNRRLAARFRGYNIGRFTEEERNKIDEDIKMWNKTHKFSERKQKIKWYGGKNITYETDPEVEAKKEADRKKAELANMDNEALINHDGKNESDVDVRQLSEQTKIRVSIERLAEFFTGRNPLKAKREEILRARLEEEKKKQEGKSNAGENDSEDTDEDEPKDERDDVERLVDEFDEAGGLKNWFKNKFSRKRNRPEEEPVDFLEGPIPDINDIEGWKQYLFGDNTPGGVRGTWNNIKGHFKRKGRAKAEGGPIEANQPTLVGDGGSDPSAAEIIVPRTSGHVLSQANGGLKVQIESISRSVMKALASVFAKELGRGKRYAGGEADESPVPVLAGFSEESTEEIMDSWGEYSPAVKKSIERYARNQKKKGASGTANIGTKEENSKKNALKEAAIAAKEREKENHASALAEIRQRGSYEAQNAAKMAAREKEEQKNVLQTIATNTGETAKHSKSHLLRSITHFGEWASMFGKTGKVAMGILMAIPIIKAAWPVLEGIWNWLKDLDIPGSIGNAISKFINDRKSHDNKNGKSGSEVVSDRLDDYTNALTNPNAETIGNVVLNDKNEVKGEFVSTVRGARGYARKGRKLVEKIPFLGKHLRDKRKAKNKKGFQEGMKVQKDIWRRATGNAKNAFGNVDEHSKEWFTNLYGKEEGATRFAEWQEDKLKYADNIEKGMSEKEAKKQFRKDQNARTKARRNARRNPTVDIPEQSSGKKRWRDKIKDKTSQKVQTIKGRAKDKATMLLNNAKDAVVGPGKGQKGDLEYILRHEGYKKSDIKSAVNMLDDTAGMGAKEVAETMGVKSTKADRYIANASSKRSTSVLGRVKNTKVGQKATSVIDNTKGVFSKFWDMFTGALDKFFSFVSEKVLKKTGDKAAKEAVEKGAQKGLKSFLSKAKGALAKGIGKIMKPVMAILGFTGAAAASGVGIPALLAKEGIFIAMEGINSLSNPRTLFMVPPDTDVDWIMNVIAGVIGGLKGTTVGSITDLAFSVIGPVIGCNCWNTIATIAYNLIANGIGDSGKYNELIKNQQALDSQYKDYKEGEANKQYKAYLKANKLDKKSYSYEQFTKDVANKKLDVQYDSFDEFNESKNKTIGGHINTAFGKTVTSVKDYVKDIKGENVKGYLDKERNLFFKESKDKYIICNVTSYDDNGVPTNYEETKDFLPKNNLNTKGLQEVEFDKKGKGFLKATGSAIKGAAKSAGGAIASFGKKLWGGVKSVAGGAADLAGKAKDAITNNNVVKTVGGAVKTAGSTVANFAKNARSNIADFGKNALDTVTGGITSIKDKLSEFGPIKAALNIGDSVSGYIMGDNDDIDVGLRDHKLMAPVGSVVEKILQVMSFGPRLVVGTVKKITSFLGNAVKFVRGVVTKTSSAVGPFVMGNAEDIDFNVPEDNPAKGVIDGFGNILQFFMTPARLVVKGVKTVGKAIGSGVKTASTIIPKLVSATGSYITGNTEHIEFDIGEDNPIGGVVNTAGNVLEFMATPIRFIIKGAKTVGSTVIGGVKTAGKAIGKLGKSVVPYIKGELADINLGLDVNNPAKGLLDGVTGVVQFLLNGPRFMFSGVKKVVGGIQSAWKFGKNFVPALFKKARSYALGKVDEIVFEGDNPVVKGIAGVVQILNSPERYIRGIFNKVTGFFADQVEPGTKNAGTIIGDYIHGKSDTVDFGIKDDSVLKPVFNAIEPITKLLMTPARLIMSIVNIVKDKVGDAIDSVQDVLGGIFDFFAGEGEGEEGKGGLGGFGNRIRKQGKKYTKRIKDEIGGYGEVNDHPYYSQRDERWANKAYNGKGDQSDMDTSGCGPTAMAMVASKYKGQITPDKVANDAVRAGFRDETGTNSKFISYEAKKLGINSKRSISPSAEEIYNSVKNGDSMILNGVSDGNPSSPYTKAGHYVVATGVDENGNIKINDPRGESYSNPISPEALADQTRAGWKFGGKRQKKKIRLGGFGKKKKDITKVSMNPHKNEPGTTTGSYATMAPVKESKVKKNTKKKGKKNTSVLATSIGTNGGKDWLGVVRSVHKAMSDESITHNYEYSAGKHKITVDGQTYEVRWDCSGFVSACLQVYGVKPKGWTTNAAGFASKAADLKEFTFMPWPGWDKLQEGDIMARSGHTEIFAGNKDGHHYVYNAGSTNAIKATSPTKSSKDSYSAIWRPNNPGAGVELVTGASGSTTASISGSSSAGGMTVLDKINNLFDQYVTKATNGLLGGEWDTKYDLTFGQSGDTSGSLNGSTASATGAWTTSTNGKAKTKEVPPGFGKTMSYMHWGLVDSPSASQTKLRKEAGWYDNQGMAHVGDRYAIAVKPYFGSPGDYLDVKFNDGTILKGVVGDQKGKENEPGHEDYNKASNKRQREMGVTNMVHTDGSVVEYIVDGKSEFGNTPKFKAYGGPASQHPAKLHPEWSQNISTITRVGSYWKDKNKGKGGSSASTTDTTTKPSKKKDTKKKTTNTKPKKTGGKGFGGFGDTDVKVLDTKDIKRLTNEMVTVEDMILPEAKSGGFGKGTKNVKVNRGGMLRGTNSQKKQGKIAIQQEVQRKSSVEADMREMKKFMKDVLDVLTDIRGNTGEIAPAIKSISVPSNGQPTSSKQKKSAKPSTTKSSTPTGINDSKNARLAMQLAKGY